MYSPIISLIALTSVSSAFAQVARPPVPSTVPAVPDVPTDPTVYAYPITRILPVPGWNSTVNSFDSLASLYTNSATQLSAQIASIARKNIELSGSGGIQYSYDVQASLASSLAIVNNLFWQTAYQAEQKVCAIVTSIDEQNVDRVKGNLFVAITTEIQVLASIAITLGNTVAAVQQQILEFSNSERAVLSTLIRAIATAARGSIGPIVKLNSGLTATGVTAIDEVVQSLERAVVGLETATTIQWTME